MAGLTLVALINIDGNGGRSGRSGILPSKSCTITSANYLQPRTTRSPLSFWGDGGIVPFEPFFFHAFPGGLEKAAINRISLILPSRKEEREILFPFRRDQEIGMQTDFTFESRYLRPRMSDINPYVIWNISKVLLISL
ncbi:hypothetical protein Fot_20429 [Forsythia ovata]|uniref:Uncharacterized protein n=1 Tax=Forsythia ovata TaxID=205694 RepID=A0ABD1UT11_9LAMI